MPSAKLATPPRRRKVNVDTDQPTRPAYEIAGEKAFLANRAKHAATSVEKAELETVLREMVAAKIEDFSVTVTLPDNAGTTAVDFSIDRSDDVVIDIEELYKLVLGKQISMEDFVSVCKTT